MFTIGDCKKSVCNKTWLASDDYALFHFTSVRVMETPHIFDDCYFYNLNINHKVSWGAPIPSTFQSFFPDLIEIIMPPGYMMLLNVVDTADRSDFRYLDNDEFIKSFLTPKGY